MPISKKVHLIKIPFQIPIAPGNILERFVNVFLIVGKKIQSAVEKISDIKSNTIDMEFVLAVLNELQLPPLIANPLLLTSFKASLDFIERKNIRIL